MANIFLEMDLPTVCVFSFRVEHKHAAYRVVCGMQSWCNHVPVFDIDLPSTYRDYANGD